MESSSRCAHRALQVPRAPLLILLRRGSPEPSPPVVDISGVCFQTPPGGPGSCPASGGLSPGTNRQAGWGRRRCPAACAHSPGTRGRLLPRGAREGTPLAPHTRHRLPAPFAGLVSLSGNSLLLLVAYRKRSTLKPAEFFIVNLAVSDLSMTVTLFPLATPSFFAHR